MSGVVEAVIVDYWQAWELGYEHVAQEGSKLGDLRKGYGASREDVEALVEIPVPMQELLEDYPGVPELDELVLYARVFTAARWQDGAAWVPTEKKPEPPAGWSPGGLLNYLLEVPGEAILREKCRERDEAEARGEQSRGGNR